MSSTLTLKSSELSPPAEQNPRSRERSRLPQERRFYQVNALPNLLLSPQQKQLEVALIETIKQIEIPATPPTLWKRLSAPVSRRSSWSSAELSSTSKQDATPLFEEKHQKGLGLSERLKHLLSHKRFTGVQPDHLAQSPTSKAELEPEVQPDQRQPPSLETQIAEFGSTPFRMTPMNESVMLSVSASPLDSDHPSLIKLRPSTSLFNITAGLDDSDSSPDRATTFMPIQERMSASQPLPDSPTVSDLSLKESAWTPRQLETSEPDSRPISPNDANASDDALLDSIVDFFESFGVGFCRTNLEGDTFGMGSPADVEPTNQRSVFRQQMAVEPA